MLHLQTVACLRGDRVLFRGLDLNVERGEALWLQGPNGSGKTSLLRVICGLAAAAAGAVLWRGTDVRLLREDLHRELIYLGDTPALKDELLVWENLAFSQRLSGRGCDRSAALQALGRLGLDGVAHLPARWLSQGQRRRVALARLHLDLPSPSLIVLDEPFNALDQAATQGLLASLNHLLAQDHVLVYTTHLDLPLQARHLHVLQLPGRVSGHAATPAPAPTCAC